MWRKTAKQIADMLKPMHKRPADAFSQRRQVTERAKPIPVPNEQIKQRINLKSPAKVCFRTCRTPFLRTEIRSSTRALFLLSFINASFFVFSPYPRYLPLNTILKIRDYQLVTDSENRWRRLAVEVVKQKLNAKVSTQGR
jgi:hypothetical protein